jgi:hypothetical protein
MTNQLCSLHQNKVLNSKMYGKVSSSLQSHNVWTLGALALFLHFSKKKKKDINYTASFVLTLSYFHGDLPAIITSGYLWLVQALFWRINSNMYLSLKGLFISELMLWHLDFVTWEVKWFSFRTCKMVLWPFPRMLC